MQQQQAEPAWRRRNPPPPAANHAPARPAPPRRSALLRLLQPLLSLARAGQASEEVAPRMLWATDTAARVLLTLLACVESGGLVLGDADALRLLSAAPLVLRMQPLALRVFAESCAAQGLRAADISPDAQPSGMVHTNLQAVARLLALATEGEDPRLPARALAAARATSLRPQALKGWLCGPGSVLDVMASFLYIVGADIVSPALFPVLLTLLEQGEECLGVAPLVEADTPEQANLLSLCTDALSWTFHTSW